MCKDKENIGFVFNGQRYTVEKRACRLGNIVLPSGKVLQADVWLESYSPPLPIGLHEMPNILTDLSPDEIARFVRGVVATKIT